MVCILCHNSEVFFAIVWLFTLNDKNSKTKQQIAKMFIVNCPNGKVLHVTKINSEFKVNELWNYLRRLGFEKENFYLTHQGRLVYEDSDVMGYVTINPKCLGGKGGFGSMLRAIGAQIEKTTNREACRDLSGRRLRDINEEKRLKVWIEKQASRANEAAERKKRKLERLRTEPNYKFEDKKYECERSMLSEKVDCAVEEGLKITKINDSKSKQIELSKKGVKRKTILDDDEDDDDDNDNDSDSDEISSNESASSNDKCNLSVSKKVKKI